jgi:hypothetical protein
VITKKKEAPRGRRKSMVKSMTEKVAELKAWIATQVDDNTTNPLYAKVIKEMKARKLHVYQVIDNVYILGGSDRVHMVSYCYISEMDDVSVAGAKNFKREFGDGYAYANVVNLSWDIEELGSIAFEIENRRMKRIG